MFKKDDFVKINFSKLDKKLPQATIQNIYNFSARHSNIHTITNIYIAGRFLDKEIKRIELDKEFVFFENELIKISKEENK